METSLSMSACARAITAEEAAFRIDYPLAYARDTRVIAFDAVAEDAVRQVADNPWGKAHFYTASHESDELISLEGERRDMRSEIEHSDSVIMVATNAVLGDAVAEVGAICRELSIMTAGLLLLEDGDLTGETLMAVRPHARILLVPADREDLFQLLTAIRA
ncbi:hypothetical protein [Microbacterium sp. Bi121]|uniref:hypothetical protein n=1 Tax=Microbacterium sp. Bi121 TaxID=2822348 RepID=UPI001D2A19DC|nr:hypothetical protein [Microbacterium sp. Bi121]CAH0148488.1 hypothetical protein SRABI121_01191 [Microbacterium sp. Bi121]